LLEKYPQIASGFDAPAFYYLALYYYLVLT